MELSFIGVCEALCILGYFFVRARRNFSALFLAVESPLRARSLLRLAVIGCMWVAIAMLYFSWRIDLFEEGKIAGRMFMFLGLFLVSTSATVVMSYFLYVGVWDEKKEEIYIVIEIWSNEFAGHLENARRHYGKKW